MLWRVCTEHDRCERRDITGEVRGRQGARHLLLEQYEFVAQRRQQPVDREVIELLRRDAESFGGLGQRLLRQLHEGEIDAPALHAHVLVVDRPGGDRPAAGEVAPFDRHGLHRDELLAGDGHGPHGRRPPGAGDALGVVEGTGRFVELSHGRVAIAVADRVEPGLRVLDRVLELAPRDEGRDRADAEDHQATRERILRETTRPPPSGSRRVAVRRDAHGHGRKCGHDARRAVEQEVGKAQERVGREADRGGAHRQRAHVEGNRQHAHEHGGDGARRGDPAVGGGHGEAGGREPRPAP